MTVLRTQQRVERSLAFIESRLEEPLSVEQIAEAAFMSPWYYSRLFRLLARMSVMDYVRRRRLTEAFKRLLATDESIMGLAVRYRFGSQQSFTRAFKQCFGHPPGEVRRKCLNLHHLQEVITVTLPQHPPGTLAGTPTIREVDGFTLCGMAREFDMQTRIQGIPELWRNFSPHIGKIPGQIGNESYGACISTGQHGEEFLYAAAVRVAPETPAPAGMVTHDVPGGRYAVFTHRGSTDTIKDTVEYIWTVWLGENGTCEYRMAPDFEYYDERFDPAAERGEMDIYIPVTPVTRIARNTG